MAQVTQRFGITPQAHYQAQKQHQQRHQEEMRILDRVRMLRREQPRLGGRKLLHLLQPMLAQEELRIGRDRFFALLGAYGLLIPRTRQATRTTWPGHLRVPNRLPGRTVNAIHQVWVVDISYLRLDNGHFVYVFLVMDLFSRYLLATYVAPSLAAQEARIALTQALGRVQSSLAGLIHHSDHGSQYTSHRYMQTLRDRAILPSMGAVGNAYDNAYAERVIGIFKTEYALEGPFQSLNQAQQDWEHNRRIYNTRRPHLSLNYATPEAVYQGRAPAPILVFPPVTEGAQAHGKPLLSEEAE